MKLTPGGLPIGGVGDSGVFAGRTRLADGGTATTDGTRIYYQSVYGTVQSCALDGSGNRLVLNQGASLIVAGGGHWAVWLAGVGMVTSWGLKLADAAVLAMTDAGDLLVIISYSTGKGLALYRAGSSTAYWALPQADPLIRYPYPQAFALDADRVLWATPAGRLLSRGLPAPAQATAAVFDPFLVDAPEGVWVGYHTDDGRLLIHPIGDASEGYELATGETYGTTATGGYVGYSRTPSESEMVSIAVDWTQPRVSLAPVAPPMPVVSVAPFSRPVWLAPFHATRYGTSVACPGHAEIVTDGDDADIRFVKRQVIADLKSEPTADAVLAIFIGSVNELDAGRKVADLRGVPLILYYETTANDLIPQSAVDRLRSTDWISQRFYCEPAESLTAFRARCFAQLGGMVRVAGGRRIMLTVQMFDRNGTETDQQKLSAMQPIWRELAEAFPSVIAIAPFAVQRTGSGVTSYPFLQQWLAAYGAAMVAPAKPVITLDEPPEEPPVNTDVPDHSSVVDALFETGAFTLDSHDGCGIFTDAAARALHAVDANWGHLAKSPGRNQYPAENGHAVDAVLYRDAGCSVDLISASETPEARPSWGVDIPRYSVSDWRDPGPQPKGLARPAIPFPVLGMTAFDWCTHRDPAWLDLHVAYGLPFLRLVVQSVWRTRRELAEGIDQLDLALPLIAAKGLGALVCIHCDTREYNQDRAGVLANTAAINAVMVEHFPLFKPFYLLGELDNENQNTNEQPFMMDPHFLKDNDALVDPRIPLSWGTMFGTAVSAAATGGSWTAHHSDRGLSPDQNGQIMARAQEQYGVSVVDREPLALAEPGTSGQRTWDVEYARGLGKAAKQYGLGGLIYHTQAGLRANVSEFGPIHRAGAVALVEGFGGSVVTPPVPPADVDALIALRQKAIASAITIAYAMLLNRKPDPIGVGIYSQRLRSEGWTVEQIEADIKGSEEYKALHGG